MPITLLLLALAFTIPQPASSQDTVRVRSTAPPQWGSNLRLTKLASFGVLDGPDEYAFGGIGAAAVDKRGNIFLYDQKQLQVRMYDSTGKYLRRIGRKGAGPGEYEIVVEMAIVQDSILVTFDPMNARLTLFKPDGKVFRTITESGATNWGDHSLGTDRNGTIYLFVARGVAGRSDRDERGGAGQTSYLRIRTDGTRMPELKLPSSKVPPATSFGAFMTSNRQAPYTGGGFLTAHDSVMRFMIRPPDGPVRVVERPRTPAPVGVEERRQLAARGAFLLARERGGARIPFVIPMTKPALKDIFSDHDGRIWVSVYAAAEDSGEQPRPAGDERGPLTTWRQRETFDVFDGLGAYLGRVVLPQQSQLMAVQGNRIWVLEKGSDDEERMVAYRFRE